MVARAVVLGEEDTDVPVASSAVIVPGTSVGIASIVVVVAVVPVAVAAAAEEEPAVSEAAVGRTLPPSVDFVFVVAPLPRLPSPVQERDPLELQVGPGLVEELGAAFASLAAGCIVPAKQPVGLHNADGDAVAFERSTVDDSSKRSGGVVDKHPLHVHSTALD